MPCVGGSIPLTPTNLEGTVKIKTELKCPMSLTGGKHEVYVYSEDSPDDVWAECSCGVNGPSRDTVKEVIDAWENNKSFNYPED